MAATSHTTLPPSSYAGLGSQGDLLHSANYGTYDTGVGLTASHPYHYQTTNYENHHTDSQLPSSYSNNYTHSQTQGYNNDKSYAAATTSNTTQATRETTVDITRGESNNQQQTSHVDTTQRNPPVPRDNQNRQSQPPSQPNRIRSEQNISNQQPPAKQQQNYQSQPAIQSNNVRSEQQNSKQAPSNGGNNQPSLTTTKTKNPPAETKTTKSNQMRAAAIKQKEDNLDQKRKDGNFPSLKKKSTPPKPQQFSLSDDEQIDKRVSKQNKKQLHPISKQHQSRYDGYQTEDNNSSVDEDTYNQQPQHKSKKSGAFSDSNYQKYPPLPPVRAGRGPPFYDPAVDYPYFLRGRYPFYYDLPIYPYPYRHRHRHLYVDGYDAPPYITSHHDSYDGFFDYQKRKSKSKTKNYKDKKESSTDREDHDGITGNETEYEDNIKTRKNKNQKIYDENDNEDDPPFYHDGEMLETWRQERNDYLKKQFKPTIHDVLYSQQWMKTDSYVENQRRRALRDSQGYYFPYKKYTLKDYKDLQKNDLQQNPYSSIEETSLDRKERVRKRQEYASHLQTIDISGGQSKTSPREIPPRKPWHLSSGEPKDPEKPSKRERALEYAKVQVIKHRAQNAPKNPSAESDPTEQYVNSLFPHINNDEQSSENDDQ